MHKVPSYLAIEELVDLQKKRRILKNFLFSGRVDEYLCHDLPLGELSMDWAQGKMILSFIEISR